MKTLIEIKNVSKAYGGKPILDDASVTFSEGQKIGVIGRNGAGKSTLCKILIGEEEEDDGKIFKSSDLTLSHLQQHDPYKLEETVIEFLMRYSGLEEWQCGKVAGRFQLKNDTLHKPIAELSGGYRTRVKLTSMLLTHPNFLILDEPTNFLDLKTLILLETFLSEYDGAFLIVSHDREFLKKTCDHTLEVENGNCTLYPGSVDEYLIFKEEQRNQAVATNKGIEAKQKQLQLFVDRFRAKASKASQAKSKMKQIQRLKTIEISHPLTNVNIRIPQVDKRNSMALECSDFAVGYPDKMIASNIHMQIQQGSHVAVLGDNGQGKTTFLRTIAGGLAPKGGKFRWGFNLKVAYYAQHVYNELTANKDIYTYLTEKAEPGVSRQEILNIAGSFLFKGDDVRKSLSVLSGGERARTCLAGLLLSKSQVLILDEPTNHLDFETVEALGRALKTFAGTVFFVSHDRTFVNLVANEIIEVKNGAIVRYPGTYEEYVYYLENKMDEELAEEDTTEAAPAKPQAKAEKPVSSYHERKAFESEKRKLAGQIKRTEQQLEALKKEHAEIDHSFVTDPNTWSRDRNMRYEELKKLIEKEEALWLELQEKAAALQQNPLNR